jgi:HlyD family type I secretion membrane fusion protein
MKQELIVFKEETHSHPLELFARKAQRAKLTGMIVILLFFGCFGAWAAVASLSSAAVAPGRVVVQGNVKTVQHLEGGIVKEVLVKEGDFVHAGQLLIRLDPTRAQTTRDALHSQYLAALALEARLVAERDNTPDIDFPETLKTAAQSDAAAARLMAAQEEIFKARRATIEGQIAILNQQLSQKKDEITGLTEQVKAEERQSALIEEETQAVKSLYEQHLETKPRLLALQRQQADLLGTRGARIATMAQLKEAMGEMRLRILDIQNQRMNAVVGDLRDVQVQIADFKDRLEAADDTLSRIDIRAPTSGIVMGLKLFTVGGVAEPGAPLLDIVPQDQKLIVEAQLSPLDIDKVHDGQIAEVRLTGLNRRTTPTIEGKVTYVSADRIDDAKGQTSYYRTYVQIDPKEVQEMTGVSLYPGMPTEVMIITGKRTPLDYLLSPIYGNMGRAFKEN